jgi:hypothetical protein
MIEPSGAPIGTENPTTEDPGAPVGGASGARRPADTADVILIPPLGLEVAAKVAEALAAIKASLAPKARNSLADALEKIAQYLGAPDPAPAPSTTPPADPAPTTPPKTP